MPEWRPLGARASVLRARGLTNVIELTGGFTDWQARGNPVERERDAELALAS